MAFDDFYQPEPEPAPAPSPPPRAAEPEPWGSSPLPSMPVQAPLRPVRSPTAQRAKAGLGIIAAAAGAAAGAAFGGPLGCVAGLAGVGALRNLYRVQGLGSSDPAEQGDAAKSLAIALVGGAIAGYLVYKVATKESR
jgi:hypothetical protein